MMARTAAPDVSLSMTRPYDYRPGFSAASQVGSSVASS